MRSGKRRAAQVLLGAGLVTIALSAGTANAAVSHTVVSGETLSGIAAANGISVESLAAWNGVSSDYLVIEGATISVPSAAEVGSPVPATTAGPTTDPAPAAGLGTIWSPWGDLHLDANAAYNWNAMRQQALTDYGVDLYPAGPLSAYRTSTQQGDMYELFLSGVGSPANPPGYSSHELGLSVDLATEEMRSVVDQIGPIYGWGKYEAPDEWWHVTYAGG